MLYTVQSRPATSKLCKVSSPPFPHSSPLIFYENVTYSWRPCYLLTKLHGGNPLSALLSFYFLAELASIWKVQPTVFLQSSRRPSALGTLQDNSSDGWRTETTGPPNGPSSPRTRALWSQIQNSTWGSKTVLHREIMFTKPPFTIIRAASFRSPSKDCILKCRTLKTPEIWHDKEFNCGNSVPEIPLSQATKEGCPGTE